MKRRYLIRAVFTGVTVAALLAASVPAAAQAGSIGRFAGRIVDEKAQPVADAEITLESVGGDQARKYQLKSNKDGGWTHSGIYAGTGAGTYTVTVKKGDLQGEARGLTARGGVRIDVPDIILSKGVGGGAGDSTAARMTAAEITEYNRKNEEFKRLSEGVAADIAASNFDAAIAKLQAIISGRDNCGVCYGALGGVYLKKGDMENAEKAHLQAIGIDPKLVGSYEDLASIYNRQRKFAEAGEMTKKAMELNAAASASAGAAGGGVTGGKDPKSFYNQGVILWNQGKGAEAVAQFQRAVELDPKYANAQYQLGLALFSDGKLAQAKTPLEEYLKLAPSGENAATAKLLLTEINKKK